MISKKFFIIENKQRKKLKNDDHDNYVCDHYIPYVKLYTNQDRIWHTNHRNI